MPSAPVTYGFLQIVGLASREPGKYRILSFALHVLPAKLKKKRTDEGTRTADLTSLLVRG
jgi:hypothetical protein